MTGLCTDTVFLNSLYAPFVFSIFFLYHPCDALDTTYILSNILYSASLKIIRIWSIVEYIFFI